MSKREMSLVLKAIDLLSVVACVVVAAVVIPGSEALGNLPAGSTLVFALGILPLLCLAIVAWRLFSAIGGGEVFTRHNAQRLRFMGYLASADALLWLLGLAAYLLSGLETHFSVVASLSVALVFTVSLTVVCAALSALTANAADIKDENDLVV